MPFPPASIGVVLVIMAWVMMSSGLRNLKLSNLALPKHDRCAGSRRRTREGENLMATDRT